MKKTLVLVVDRDDDFGVKGKVNTPVIGVQNCLDAATAFGIADPEDSDLNALYAAVSVCLEIQEDGHDADVALICGDEKVGHRSDLALVAQLEEVLETCVPDSVVLVGDGAEDEYIYPIISSRAHVDSVRKVYVKQAPGLEGSLYILTRTMSDPAKRRRFLAPLGFITMMVAAVLMVPGLLEFVRTNDIAAIANMSAAISVLVVGLFLTLYAYDVEEKLVVLRRYVRDSVLGHSTRLIFLCISFSIIIISAIWVFYEVSDMYAVGLLPRVLYYTASMVWPITIALIVYTLGLSIEEYLSSNTILLSRVFACVDLAALALVALAILDIIQSYVTASYDTGSLGVVGIVAGVLISLASTFVKSRMRSNPLEVPADDVP